MPPCPNTQKVWYPEVATPASTALSPTDTITYAQNAKRPLSKKFDARLPPLAASLSAFPPSPSGLARPFSRVRFSFEASLNAPQTPRGHLHAPVPTTSCLKTEMRPPYKHFDLGRAGD